MIYHINEPRIAHETIDNETIIIDFETGVYFSARAEANLIWQALCKGHNLEIITESLAVGFKEDRHLIFSQVKEFVTQLLEREIIMEVTPEQSASEIPSDVKQEHIVTSDPLASDFKQPILEIHTDMQELLLLDPVHDINAKGWPNKK